MCARAVLNLCSSITACSRGDTLTGAHAWEWDQILFFSNKQGTECTEDCFTVKRRWIGHLQSLPSWHRFKVASVEVCGWVWVCVRLWLYASGRGCCVCPAPYTFIPSSSLCQHFFNLRQGVTHLDPIGWTQAQPTKNLLSLCARASKTDHLRMTTSYRFTLKPATYFSPHHKVSFSLHLSSRDASLFLMTSDIISAIYFQALMQCGVCGWGGSLGAPGSGLAFMWSGPTWSGIWPGPAGPPSGSRELMCSQPGMPDIWSQTC